MDMKDEEKFIVYLYQVSLIWFMSFILKFQVILLMLLFKILFRVSLWRT